MTEKIASRDAGRRIAAIDVGTNSIRLIVAEVTSDGGYRVIDDEKEITRLGKGLNKTGRLADDTLTTSAETIARMHGIASGYEVDEIRAIATSAVREASNGTELVNAVRSRVGLLVEVISAEEEARLAHRSVARAFDIRNSHAAIADIGGGSTEVIISAAGVIEQVFTLRLGAVLLTEQFGVCEDPEGAQFRAMRREVRRVLRDEMKRPDTPVQAMYGSGGTFSSLASMLAHRNIPSMTSDLLPSNLSGFDAQRDEVHHLLDRLQKLPVRERARTPGLSPERADIIVAGLLLADEVMRRLHVNRVRVHDRGIRDGLLLSMLGDDEPHDDAHDRVRSAEKFAEACRYEEPHCRHVAALALEIFDDLVFGLDAADAEWATAECRELLHAAALLHDVGYLINYSKHHKHSYHLIAHSDLAAFSIREREIVANVARYHRRATPARKHPNFAKLSDADQQIVRRLASILRVADGLDRTHMQSVQSVSARIREGEVALDVAAETEPRVDIWGAMQKSNLFVETFGARLTITWTPPAESSGDKPADAPPINPIETTHESAQ